MGNANSTANPPLPAIWSEPNVANLLRYTFSRLAPMPYEHAKMTLAGQQNCLAQWNCEGKLLNRRQKYRQFCRKCGLPMCSKCFKAALNFQFPMFICPMPVCPTCHQLLTEGVKDTQEHWDFIDANLKDILHSGKNKNSPADPFNSVTISSYPAQAVAKSAVIGTAAVRGGSQAMVQTAGSFSVATVGAAVITVPLQAGFLVYSLVHLHHRHRLDQIDSDGLKVGIAAETGRFALSAGGAVAGAAAGVAIGSVVPGVGNVGGLLIGAAIGSVASLILGTTAHLSIQELGSFIAKKVKETRPSGEVLRFQERLLEAIVNWLSIRALGDSLRDMSDLADKHLKELSCMEWKEKPSNNDAKRLPIHSCPDDNRLQRYRQLHSGVDHLIKLHFDSGTDVVVNIEDPRCVDYFANAERELKAIGESTSLLTALLRVVNFWKNVAVALQRLDLLKANCDTLICLAIYFLTRSAPNNFVSVVRQLDEQQNHLGIGGSFSYWLVTFVAATEFLLGQLQLEEKQLGHS